MPTSSDAMIPAAPLMPHHARIGTIPNRNITPPSENQAKKLCHDQRPWVRGDISPPRIDSITSKIRTHRDVFTRNATSLIRPENSPPEISNPFLRFPPFGFHKNNFAQNPFLARLYAENLMKMSHLLPNPTNIRNSPPFSQNILGNIYQSPSFVPPAFMASNSMSNFLPFDPTLRSPEWLRHLYASRSTHDVMSNVSDCSSPEIGSHLNSPSGESVTSPIPSKFSVASIVGTWNTALRIITAT